LIPEECRPAAQANDARPIRLLHLSDIHFRADKACDAEPVLRELASFVESEVERTMLLVRHVAYLDWYAGWLGAPPQPLPWWQRGAAHHREPAAALASRREIRLLARNTVMLTALAIDSRGVGWVRRPGTSVSKCRQAWRAP
jgi:hypothetical protein